MGCGCCKSVPMSGYAGDMAMGGAPKMPSPSKFCDSDGRVNGAVTAEFGRLRETIFQLEHTVTTVYDRLAPVLVPEGLDDGDSKAGPRPANSPLAEETEAMRDLLAWQVRRLNYLIGRIDV